jgi:ribosomal protein S18 acetylase RimI-like enzyme
MVVNKIKNPEILSSIAFKNFIYLSQFPELMHSEKNIYKALQEEGNLCYLVYDKNVLIAYLIGDFRTLADNRYVYYISYFYVAEKYRGKKLGSKIMDMIINKCQNLGVKFIVLTCDTQDTKIINFYRKYGFVKDPILGTGEKRHNVYCLYL